MRSNSTRKNLLWVPAMVAVLAIGTGIVWSAGGADGTEREVVQTAPIDAVQMQVDESYYAAVGPRRPGVIPGSPAPVEGAVPVGGPRAKPGLVNVLVYTDTAVTAAVVRRADVQAFAAERGGVVKYEYGAVLPGVFNLRDLPESELEALERLPGVIKVERDEYHPNVLLLHDSTPLIRALQSQITGAGYSADGTGVRICVCDTGIDSDHIMYADRIDTAAGYDFFNDDSNPEDDHGHGSHCSGIALGGTGISWDPCGTGAEPFQGVAPKATLIGVKVLNQFGGGYDSDIIAGIDYCGDQSASGAQADVISLSIGTGSFSAPCTHSWAVAANNAVANGVVVVAASGNDAYSNALKSPACGADVIAVGATYKADYPTCEDNVSTFSWSVCTDYAPVNEDQIVCFSNQSDYLDVAAPGAIIWSASNQAGGNYIVGMSGTSMACPHVAGLAALILSMDGSLTPVEVRTIIRDGAIDMGSTGFDRAYGYGRIDVLDSLALVGPACTIPADCDDGNECTEDLCVEGSCQNNPYPDDTPCTGGVCCGGTCTAVVCSVDIDCDDFNECTTDTCTNPDTCSAACSNTPVADDTPCTGGVCCSGTCTAPACWIDTDCDDGNECTTDTCTNPDTCSAACSNTPVADDTPCTGGVCCGGTCTAPVCSSDLDCDDAEACTTDTCTDPGLCSAACVNDPIVCPPSETCVDGVCVPEVCDNDGTCEEGEDCYNCPNDCISGTGGAVCGNGLCEAGDGEDCNNCPGDCNGLQTGKPDYRFCCGATEGCDDTRCTEPGWSCTTTPQGVAYCCGDGVCEGAEDYTNCYDCPEPYCGDGSCDPGEDQCNCSADCGTPPLTETNCTDGIDNDCDGMTDMEDPDCECTPSGEPCTTDEECCSGSCHPVKDYCK